MDVWTNEEVVLSTRLFLLKRTGYRIRKRKHYLKHILSKPHNSKHPPIVTAVLYSHTRVSNRCLPCQRNNNHHQQQQQHHNTHQQSKRHPNARPLHMPSPPNPPSPAIPNKTASSTPSNPPCTNPTTTFPPPSPPSNHASPQRLRRVIKPSALFSPRTILLLLLPPPIPPIPTKILLLKNYCHYWWPIHPY